ncbi:hypothetical protein BKA70DRAFT_625848 [Coprinopsis sp. MPI-PUGE-AT-0042]|nr:hypothetical protein BKA70DRAFT_625848 [Coprinopsis sp. MPI-PUGE-AT-0042]
MVVGPFVSLEPVNADPKQRVARDLRQAFARTSYSNASTSSTRGRSEVVRKCSQNLLDFDNDEDMQRMYAFLSRIPVGLEPLRKRLKGPVNAAGLGGPPRPTSMFSSKCIARTRRRSLGASRVMLGSMPVLTTLANSSSTTMLPPAHLPPNPSSSSRSPPICCFARP